MRISAVCADAPAGYEVVTVDVNVSAGGGFERDAAVCPPGTRVLGGGARVIGAGSADHGTRLQESGPGSLGGQDTWLVAVRNDGASARTLRISAVCAAEDSGSGNQPPVISGINANPANPTVGQAVSFTVGVNDPDGDPLSYDWDFGDGTTDTGLPISYTYGSAGNYTVELTVEDGQGGSDTATVALTVQAGGSGNEAPSAAFAVSPADPSVGQAVSFANNSSDPDGDPLTYQWDFGDGATSSDASPSHTYNSAGSFTVQLTVTDDNGNSDTASQTINVQASSGGGGGGSGQGGLGQYDTNPQNCRIDQAELIVMIDDWINGNILQSLLLDGINAWIDQADICAGSSGLASPSLEDVRVQSRSTAAGVLFSAQTDRALDVRSMEVRIFGLDGRPIARKQANRGTLAWNLTTDDGDRIANGVYLYRVTVTGPTGNVERGQMRKLTVLR